MLKFLYPVHGDMPTGAAGLILPDGDLLIEAAVSADCSPVLIDGRNAAENNGVWTAQLRLHIGWNIISARAGTEETSVSVCYLPHAAGHYALSVDDNLWWLAELNERAYASLFDHPFLAVFREAHELYGAKVRLNLFYEPSGSELLAQRHAGFNLSRMTDRYREEFIANADWLHLAFHARREFPDAPYIASGHDEAAEDCRLVHQEICRFAGEQSLEKATTVHFGECSAPGRQALMEQGVHALMGYMTLNAAGKPYVSYEMTPQQVKSIQRYGFWRDPADGMIYGKIAVVLNLFSPAEIPALLEQERKAYPLRSFVEIMIHEQYFHDSYSNYEPDYRKRIMAGCRWCHEHGLTGAFTADAARIP